MSVTLTLVGRTNVGKSTLFNHLTHTKAALTQDTAGVTRDRRYGFVTYGAHLYTLIDTGGLSAIEDPLAPLIKQQVNYAIQQAHCIGLVVDGRDGLVYQDEQIALFLRRFGKPILGIISKVEGNLSIEAAVSTFAPLGLPLYPTSALQGKGFSPLLDAVSQHKTTSLIKQSFTTDSSPSSIKIAIIGRPNVGKSTLINRLVGETRQIVSDQAGTTRDSIDINLDYQGQRYTLIDTAGIRRSANIEPGLELASVEQSLHSLRGSVVVLLIIDATSGLTDQDLRLLQRTIESGRAIIMLCNKWDKLDKEAKLGFQADCKRRLRFARFVTTGFISSLYGTGLHKIIPLVKNVYAQATKKLSTPKLTRLLQQAQTAYAPPRTIKLRYAHPGGYNPPVIVIHGTHVRDISNTYKRYLHNFYQQQLAITGTPLKLEFIEKGSNQ